MSYLTSEKHASLLADPAAIAPLYQEEKARFVQSLGSGFASEIEEHIQLAFCAMVAYDLKPYGVCTVLDLPGLLAAPELDCDNYAALTLHLFKILTPCPATQIAVVGWSGGPIGNHAQIFCHKPADANGSGGGAWLIDPTVAVFQCGYRFDWVAAGKPTLGTYRKSLHWREGVVDWLHGAVLNALGNGLYRPSHLLYYFRGLDAYRAAAPQSAWATPQSVA